jgi:hypothetical protein
MDVVGRTGYISAKAYEGGSSNEVVSLVQVTFADGSSCTLSA